MPLPLAYSTRNLFARRQRTLLTVTVIALVVLATTLFWSLVGSLKRTLVSTGDPENLIVMRKGASNDGSSQLTLAALQAIRFFEGIARDERDQPLISAELVVQPFLRTRDGVRENVLVRGVELVALQVHDEVRMRSGRMFEPSQGEAIVGRGVTLRYPGAVVGSDLRFGRGIWKVVGEFEAGGSAFESEIWVDVRELANDAKRVMPFSGFRVRVAPGADMDALARRIGEDPRYALEALPEVEYYEEQAESANTLYVIVVGLALLAGIGAVFGAANTMFAAVQARTAEIGTLRALGFSRASIVTAFLLESLLLASLGFAVGAGAAVLLGAGVSEWLGGVGFGGRTFSTNVIEIRVAATDLWLPLGLTLAIGTVGGLAPALRAARLRPIEALHRA
jgi:ABC-type antimicrobial peptide transport system permease subunit